MFRVDFHVHTRYSGDNEAEPGEMAEAAIVRGLHAIAFTEHYYYEASDYAGALAERFPALTILRGVEFSALEGHCLVFGVNTDRLGIGGAPVAELARVVGEHGGVVIPAHPFRGGSGIGRMVSTLPGLTALEGHNGCNPPMMNRMALEAAHQRGLPVTGGSDAHMAREVGACHTEFDEPVNQNNLVAMLRAGRYRAVDARAFGKPI